MIIIFSFREHHELRCPRGCCHEGSIREDAKVAFFKDEEQAAQHIADLDLSTDGISLSDRRSGADARYSHSIGFSENLDMLDGHVTHGDSMSTIMGEYEDSDEYDAAVDKAQKIKSRAAQLAAMTTKQREESKKLAEAEAAARKADEERERAGREAIEQMKMERVELARLKLKYPE